MKDINNFISEIKTVGLAATNRYSVFFNPPEVLLGVGFNDTVFRDRMLLYCSQAQLPGMNISTAQSRTFGEIREVPYERLFDNVSLTFYIDSEMKIKEFWDTWINSIQDPDIRTFNFYNDYITDIDIYVENRADDSVYQVTLYEAFPKTMSAIQLSHDQKDIMQLSITMSYRYWKPTRFGVYIPSAVENQFAPDEAELERINTPSIAPKKFLYKQPVEKKVKTGFNLRNYIPPFLKNVI